VTFERVIFVMQADRHRQTDTHHTDTLMHRNKPTSLPTGGEVKSARFKNTAKSALN